MSDSIQKDHLTGLLSRPAYDEKFTSFMGVASDTGRPLSVAFLDIDYFFQINQDHGHEGGDRVLEAIASILRSQAGDDVLIARYGGDEFALLFPNTEREQAFLVLEKIRAAISGHEDFNGVKSSITITGGIASFPIDGSSESEIVRKADQALYRAKKTGRNKIRLAYEEKMAPKTSHFTLTQLERLSALSDEEGVGEAVLLREALDDLLLKYRVTNIES